MNLDPIYVALLAIFFGILSRTLLPYLRKRREAAKKEPTEILAFDAVYLETAIYSLIVSMIATILIFPAYAIPDVPAVYVFASAFAYGWMSNDVINEVIA